MTKYILLLLSVLPSLACTAPPQSTSRVQPAYDAKTGRLTELTYDDNRNGRIDTWVHMNGTRILRAESDHDEDGRIDRWEYYRAAGSLEKVGVSRLDDGVVDAWAFEDAKGKISRIEISTRRDGQVDRVEFFADGILERVEEDTNRDGRSDKWETYHDAALTIVAFDTRGRGKPDRRLVYHVDGTLDHLEVDADGDGTFKAVNRYDVKSK
jgi:hypothetical protein